ncbi:hypothetical protein C8J56DRAFT_1159867 [Mycena floridula]|nr:hypothetical protein C8J56DRAFT_1159867 [Mycena floridula]
MSACNGSCKSCCSLNSTPVFETLAISHDDMMSLLRNNASSIDDITDASIRASVMPKARDDLRRCLSLIQRCEEERKRLEDLLAVLSTQREVLEEVHDSCQSLDAPIRRIPTEILSKIFIFLETKSQFANDRTNVEAFQVARVCYHWRTVAQSTRSLWSNITLFDSIPNGCQQLAVFDRHLELSGSHPLTIRVAASIPRLGTQLVARLLQHSDRLIHTEFSQKYPELFNKQPTLSFANLQHLKIHLNCKDCPWPPTPRLQSLIITGGHRTQWAIQRLVQLPVNDLGATVSHLVLMNLPLNLVLEFVTRSPSLMSLTIGRCDVKTLGNAPLIACTSPLNSLSTKECPASILEVLFQQLDCPNLRKLAVDRGRVTDGRGFYPFPHTFVSLLNRNKPPVQQLTFKGFTVSEAAMVEILELTPYLRRLQLHASSILLGSASMLHRMHPNHKSLLIPSLNELTLWIKKGVSKTFPTQAFVDMIRLRWKPWTARPGLKKVRVVLQFQLDDSDVTLLSPLKVLKAKGMEIELIDSEGEISLDTNQSKDSEG